MDPVTIAAGASAISGLVQLYNSEQARGATKDRLNQIEALYNQIKPPNYNLSIQDPPALHTQTLASPQFSSPIAAPQFNLDKLSPEQYKQLGQYVPQVASYVAEKGPTTLQNSANMQQGRQAQLDALKKFMQVGATSFDPEYQQATQQAARQAQGEAQSRQQSLLQDYARRGQGGSGVALAAQLGAASSAMDRNAMANQQAATDAYKNRLNALSQGATLGGQISNQDLNMQEQNANIINSFNQRMAASQQLNVNQNTSAQNDANKYNIGVAQGLANQNVTGANQAAQNNQDRQDALAKYNYQNALGQQNRADSISKYNYGNSLDERNFQNQAATQLSNWQDSQRRYNNSMLGQAYNDQINQASGRAGLASQLNNNTMQSAQDRNQALQGLTNAGMTYAQGQQAYGANRANQASKADQAYFQQNGRFMNDAELQGYKQRQDSYDYY